MRGWNRGLLAVTFDTLVDLISGLTGLRFIEIPAYFNGAGDGRPLQIPLSDVKIVRVSYQIESDSITFLLEHPKLPFVREGDIAPYVYGIIRQVEPPKVEVWKAPAKRAYELDEIFSLTDTPT